MPRVHESTPEFEEFGHGHYGLGFRSTIYRGDPVTGHTGGWLGWSTMMRLVPRRKISVLRFSTNTGANPLPTILVSRISTIISAGLEPAPWLDRFRDMRRKALAQQVIRRRGRGPPRTSRIRNRAMILRIFAAPMSIRPMAGWSSRSPGDSLHWAWRGTKAPLSHKHYDFIQLPFVYGELNPD